MSRLRRALLVLCLLLTPSQGWAAQTVTFGSNASDNAAFDTDGIAEVALAITAGNFTCVGFSIDGTGRTVSSVVDDGSNTYTLADTDEISGTLRIWMYCGTATNSATQITVTLSAAVATGHVFAWTVTESASAVGNTSSGVTNPASTSHSSGAVAITGAASVMVGFSFFGANSAPTIDADYTQSLNRQTLVAGYRAVTAGDTMVNTTGGNRQSATILTEIPSSVAASGPPVGSLMLLGVGK